MKTSEIISAQLKHINLNSAEYFKICTPYIVLAFLSEVVFKNVPEYVNYILLLITYLISILLIVNVHRFVILNEKYNFSH